MDPLVAEVNSLGHEASNASMDDIPDIPLMTFAPQIPVSSQGCEDEMVIKSHTCCFKRFGSGVRNKSYQISNDQQQ
eukprot:6469540-Amphidinium_carterae.1